MICISNTQRGRLHNIICCQGKQGPRKEENKEGSKEGRKERIHNFKKKKTSLRQRGGEKSTERIWRGIREVCLISQGKELEEDRGKAEGGDEEKDTSGQSGMRGYKKQAKMQNWERKKIKSGRRRRNLILEGRRTEMLGFIRTRVENKTERNNPNHDGNV